MLPLGRAFPDAVDRLMGDRKTFFRSLRKAKLKLVPSGTTVVGNKVAHGFPLVHAELPHLANPRSQFIRLFEVSWVVSTDLT